MKRIENGKITLEASKRAIDFKNKVPSEIIDLVIYYVDTFCYINTMFESAGVEVDENTVLELTKEIMNKCYEEK